MIYLAAFIGKSSTKWKLESLSLWSAMFKLMIYHVEAYDLPFSRNCRNKRFWPKLDHKLKLCFGKKTKTWKTCPKYFKLMIYLTLEIAERSVFGNAKWQFMIYLFLAPQKARWIMNCHFLTWPFMIYLGFWGVLCFFFIYGGVVVLLGFCCFVVFLFLLLCCCFVFLLSLFLLLLFPPEHPK